jgi:FHA domain/Domain of unknown function (DUF1707)
MADTPGTPDYLRVSDAERDRAIDELKRQFADGRLSQDTFLLRMNNALGARNRGQLTGLFDDLPARHGRVTRAFGAIRDLASRAFAAPRSRTRYAPALAEDDSVPVPRAPAPKAPPVPLRFPRDMGTTFTIGRHQGCDLQIADMSVSRLHARLARDAEGWLLTDLGSTNGTRLNGWRVRQTVPVRAGDLVRFGSVDFVMAPGQVDAGSPDALLTIPLGPGPGPAAEELGPASVGLGPVAPADPPGPAA